MTALVCEDLEHRFDAGPTILDIPRFELGAGEQCGVRGRSGSGKTTFLNVVGGILVPTSGRVRVADTTISDLPEAKRDLARGRHVGYVFQSFHLLSGLTAIENVQCAMMFAGRVDPSRAQSLLDRLGLGALADRKPRQLSVGQQQRVALARALANEPALVLADEPTASLDPETSGDAVKLLRDVCEERGSALLLVSHDPNVLAGIERVIEFSDLNRAAASATSGGAA